MLKNKTRAWTWHVSPSSPQRRDEEKRIGTDEAEKKASTQIHTRATTRILKEICTHPLPLFRFVAAWLNIFPKAFTRNTTLCFTLPTPNWKEEVARGALRSRLSFVTTTWASKLRTAAAKCTWVSAFFILGSCGSSLSLSLSLSLFSSLHTALTWLVSLLIRVRLPRPVRHGAVSLSHSLSLFHLSLLSLRLSPSLSHFSLSPLSPLSSLSSSFSSLSLFSLSLPAFLRSLLLFCVLNTVANQ